MRALACLAGVAALAAAGCGDDGGDGGGTEAGADADIATEADASTESVRYEHPLFEDPEDCPDDPLFNCTPILELCPDGTAMMLVTDIVSSGTYERAADVITTEWESGDVPPAIAFSVAEDGRVLTDDWQGWEWTRAEDEFSFCN